MSLGDPQFVNTTGPISALTSDAYMHQLQSIILNDNVLPLERYGGKYNMSYAQNQDHGNNNAM